MKNTELVHQFYTSFSEGNAQGMIQCYHENIVFEDPAFGKLKGEKAKAMWTMLMSKKKESEMSISFELVNENQARWTATYKYGPKKAPVTNLVTAHFKFKEGKIIEHRDDFSLWKWSQQALGGSGYLLGWTGFMKSKIQATTNKLLDHFMAENNTSA